MTLSAKDIQKLSKLSKEFKTSVYWNEYKTKNENRNAANEYRYFLELDFAEVSRLLILIHSNQDDNMKR